jgi:hypothetical protein
LSLVPSTLNSLSVRAHIQLPVHPRNGSSRSPTNMLRTSNSGPSASCFSRVFSGLLAVSYYPPYLVDKMRCFKRRLPTTDPFERSIDVCGRLIKRFLGCSAGCFFFNFVFLYPVMATILPLVSFFSSNTRSRFSFHPG